MMLTGIAPFKGSGAKLFEMKKNGVVTFEVFAPSEAAQDLVLKLLRVNPKKRFTIDEVLEHEWMTTPNEYLENFDLSLALSFIQDWKETPAEL
jgi:serine/threonine protein kinase